MDSPSTSAIEIPAHIITVLQQARHIAVMTGAGVSAESGIATFRDALTGLWKNFNAQDLATPEAFQRDPVLVWGWYEARRAQVLQAEPNAGHYALAQMAKHVPLFTLITQNVDNLHERAGSENVLHLHGSLLQARCFDCGSECPELPPPLIASSETPPHCAECNGLLRPGVVWFGESLPHDIWQKSEKAVRDCNVLIVVGTSGVVYPAAGLAQLAMRRRRTVIQINPNRTEQNQYASFTMQGPAGTCLPQLLEAAWPTVNQLGNSHEELGA